MTLCLRWWVRSPRLSAFFCAGWDTQLLQLQVWRGKFVTPQFGTSNAFGSATALFLLSQETLRDEELGRRRVTDVLLQGRQAMSMQRKRPPPVLVPVVAGLTSQLCDAALPEDVRRTGETRLDDVVTTGSSVSRALGRLG